MTEQCESRGPSHLADTQVDTQQADAERTDGLWPPAQNAPTLDATTDPELFSLHEIIQTHGAATSMAARSAQGRIGIFGGTFDPPHLGHLILAEEAWYQLGLDCVYLVPAADPPHKQDQRLMPVGHRVRMAQLAAADNDHIRISSIDIDRPGPHYTADMVRMLNEKLEGQTDLYFLMGLDSLRDLPAWRQAAWLVENSRLVALSRHDVTLDWDYLEAELPGIRDRVVILDMPELELASHILRARVREGRPIRYQVPRAVEQYVYEHRLYR